jgi:hypothetical protein
MKLRLESKRIKAGEDTEFPEFAFDFAYGGVGTPDGQEIDISYMVPSSKEDSIKAMASRNFSTFNGEV